MIHKKDIPSLTPTALIYGVASTDRFADPFVFGQMLQLGPVLPINIGSMASPPVQFLGRLIVSYQNKILNKISMLKFPSIPGEKSTRYGELAKSLAQSMKLNLPSLKEMGLIIDSEGWPWNQQFDKLPRIHAMFSFIFSFNGIIQKPSIVDKDHICRQDYSLNLEVPIEIISYQYGMNASLLTDIMRKTLDDRRQRQESPRITNGKAIPAPAEIDRSLVQGGDAMSIPRSILWNEQMSFQVSTFVYNRLQNIDYNKVNLARVVLSVAAFHGYAQMKNVTAGHSTTGGANDIYTEIPVDPKETKYQGLQRSSLISTIPILPKGKAKEMVFQVTIPAKQKKPNSNEDTFVPPGCNILLREELMYDEIIAEVTPYQSLRIAAPWPPANQPDIILFTDSTFLYNDYQIIDKLVQTIDLKVAYFDYEHFFTMNNSIQYALNPTTHSSKLSSQVWSNYLGKVSVLWFPTTNELSNMGNHVDFINHIKQYGGFMNGNLSLKVNPFQIPSEMNNFLVKEMRNVIQQPESFNIHSLKEITQDFSISSDRITGHYNVLQFYIGLFLSMKLEKKLDYLYNQQTKTILNIIISNTIQLTDYHSEIEVGCCGGGKKSKIFPSKKSNLTVRDVLLVAIRTELMMDLGSLAGTNNIAYCFGINTLLAYCENIRLASYKGRSPPKHIAFFARDIIAVINTANIMQKEKFSDNKTNKIFAPLQLKLQLLVTICQSIADEHKIDHFGFTERISDLDILNGFSSRVRGVNSDRDPINIGRGVQLHLKGKFN